MEKEDNRSETAFNMAVATLKRIDEILKDISEISTNIPDITYANYIKYKKIKDLFLASVPLIEDGEKKEKLRKRIRSLSLLFRTIKNQQTNQITNICHKNAEEILDYVIQDIQQSLQDAEGYFMPSKNDSNQGDLKKED